LTQYILRRILLFIPTLLLVTGLIFTVLRVIPGDVAKMIVTGGGEGRFSQQAYQAVRKQLGLDQPLVVQYGHWAGAAMTGDLGVSYWAKGSVRDELAQRLPVTLELAIAAPLLALALGVPLGVISAVRQNTPLDHATRAVSITGLAVPHFWLGILIILLLANAFGWIIPLRYANLWQDPVTNIQQMFWPVVVLATGFMALLARVTRSAMLDVLRSDYIRTAHAKGLRGLTVVGRHGLRNAILPIATIFGAQLGALISGAVVTERVFNIPGMGRFFVEAVFQRDFPVVQAVVLLVATAYLVVNLAVDLAYAWLDPRIRYA
jgi:peptide/nickel transport system permease protein